MNDDGPAVTGLQATAGEHLRTWVQEDFSIDLVLMDAVEHGADEEVELWRGRAVDGAPYAVKLGGGGTPAGLIVSVRLVEQGVPGVVRPVPTRHGRLWSDREGRRLSVVPWVSDERALSGGMSAQHWVSYGALLAKVHATAVTDALAHFLPREEHTHEQVTATVRALDSRLRRLADEPEGMADHLARALADKWCAAPGHVSTLLEQADGLGRELRTRQAPGVICHGDPHLGNVLIAGDEQLWLIDWDDAVLAPRERDLMFVIGGVLAFAPVTTREQSWFFDGYGAADLDPTRLAYYRCTRALEDLTPAAHVIDVHRRTEPERADALSIVRGVLSPTGLVSLALTSVRELGRIPDESPPPGSDIPD